jgi:hypothetical protein
MRDGAREILELMEFQNLAVGNIRVAALIHVDFEKELQNVLIVGPGIAKQMPRPVVPLEECR